MNWFYVYNDQQAGPVSDGQLDELLRAGTINRGTLVWREGMPEWKPLSTVRPGLPPPLVTPGVQTNVCAECGQSFPVGDMIQLNRTWVCAGCKPVFLQKMTEGVAPTAAGGMWRMNKQLVTVSDTPFPDRCVKCNAPAGGYRLKRVLYWQHPAYYFLLLCNLLILLIVIMIVRKKAILQIPLCEVHRAQRKQFILIGWLGSLGGLAIAIIGGVAFSSTMAAISILAGILIFLGCMLYGLIRSPMVSAAKIDKQNVWVRGVGADFLAKLPDWIGS